MQRHPFSVFVRDGRLCLMTMRLIEPNEVFDDPLAMEVPTNRGDIFCEIDGLPIMYNVFQRLPFYTNSLLYCNGKPSDQRAELFQ